eukprot:5863154-Prymnesium_polylepis.2
MEGYSTVACKLPGSPPLFGGGGLFGDLQQSTPPFGIICFSCFCATPTHASRWPRQGHCGLSRSTQRSWSGPSFVTPERPGRIMCGSCRGSNASTTKSSYRGSKREWSWVDLARSVVGLVENVYCNEDGEVVDKRFLYWTDVDDALSLSRALDRASRRLVSQLLVIAAAVGSTNCVNILLFLGAPVDEI